MVAPARAAATRTTKRTMPISLRFITTSHVLQMSPLVTLAHSKNGDPGLRDTGNRSKPAAAQFSHTPCVRVVVLGCGFHGRGIAYQLADSVDVCVFDRDGERAAAVGAKAGVPWGTVDVTDA